MRILVVGVGEVGKQIMEIARRTGYNVQGLDLQPKEIEMPIDVMHICYRYGDRFIETTVNYIKKFKPNLTIIESTVIPETTKNIYEQVGGLVVHSPVRAGSHPIHYTELYKYIKMIGPTSEEAGRLAKEYYEEMKVPTMILSGSTATELGKLFSTTYYTTLIALHQEYGRICEKYNVKFEEACDRFHETYGLGYNLSVFPRAKFWNGFIGGHCCIPNVKKLDKVFPSKLWKAILDSNERKKKELTEK